MHEFVSGDPALPPWAITLARLMNYRRKHDKKESAGGYENAE